MAAAGVGHHAVGGEAAADLLGVRDVDRDEPAVILTPRLDA